MSKATSKICLRCKKEVTDDNSVEDYCLKCWFLASLKERDNE